jgi:UDP-2,4-diacetamido-2,4,6-trideoxy-beta-L-altropyranose hydrolase
MLITLLFDEGPGIGLGHRRRMEVLAGALDALGFDNELRRLRPDENVDAAFLVIDSYMARADNASRFSATRIVAIEDLGRDLDVDLVVDPDPGAEAATYTRAKHLLVGPKFALVDPALRALDTAALCPAVQRVLVTTGAADSAGTGAAVASTIAHTLTHAEIRYIGGPWGESGDDPRVRVIEAPNGLASELATADLVVTAGGVTMLESCCLGRPTVALSTAPNQTRAVAGAAHLGAVLAADPTSAPDVAARLANNHDLRKRLSMTARALVDGQGATRVAAAIATIASHDVQSR